MPIPPSHRARAATVARLRAAGCVYAEDEARMLICAATTRAELDALLDRRLAGVPLEHVLGFAEFCGLRIAVDTGVFVPRRRTEFLVRQAALLARPGAVVVVDLCCGSGAIGAALAAAVGQVELHGADIDAAAVQCARRNVGAVGGQVYQGDLYEPLGHLRGRVDILVASAPYVPTDAIGLMPAEARQHEPRRALDGGADGLEILRRVISAAPRWLAPAGSLLIETNERQAPQAVEIIAGSGLVPGVARSEELSATIVFGTRRAPARA